jgi:medium-chain acyl-[acyl-carrier-protein] hydrolase
MADWFACPRPVPAAGLRLYCFPYAGGGVPAFRAWPDGLPPTVEVRVAQLPGRGARIRETPFARLGPLVAALAAALRPTLDRPFAFFGHSLGALVGFELARALRRQGGPQPARLFVSGHAAPHLPQSGPAIHALPDAAFRDELRRLDGTPVEILDNQEVMQLLLPALRADFAASEAYAYTAEPPLECPIAAFGGAEDERVSRPALEAWRKQTRAAFSLKMFPGGHFFLHSARQAVLRALREELERQ